MRDSEYCLNHDPSRAEENRRRSSKGGKKAGRGRPLAALAWVREENADIRRRLLEGELLPNVAAVAIQSLNCDIRTLSVEMEVKEQEFDERLERLETVEETVKELMEERNGAMH